jgi:hypothetical protein
MLGEMLIMDRTGHTRTTWNPDEEDEVEVARQMFDDLTRKGYSAFRTKGADDVGKRLKSFDPKAGSMILVPNLVGG